ncbi:MAG: hypothetical protein Q8O87_02150 [bacterium]|nr:hypothetical protein [bacterium]
MNPTIKSRLFWRIYAIWFVRRILPLMLVQVLVAALGLKIFAHKVFVSEVLKNAAIGQLGDATYWAFLKYLFNAFLGTNPLVQVAILLVLGLGALVLRDLGRALAIYFKRR